jgi:NAD(P)H-flavin reductase
MTNIYVPYLMRVEDVIEETPDTRTFSLVFQDEALREAFEFRVGQFALYSAFGAGESTFCIANPATRKGYVETTFRRVGRVTATLADLNVGDTVGFRGPFGNWFPMEQFQGKHILFIAGGIGLPPVRSVVWECLDTRERYGELTILYGARSVRDLVYKREIAHWEERPDVRLVKTVDPGGETLEWDGKVGFVPTVLKDLAPKPDNAVAIICGPPIMIKYSLQALEELGWSGEQVYTTLENKMKCGLGKCGRCNIGDLYICKEGPVFTAAEVKRMYPDF